MKNLKRIFLITLVITMVAMSIVGASSMIKKINAYVNPEINVVVNGENFTAKDENGNSFEPIIYKGHTYLPARYLSEELGATVKWDSKNKTVVIGENKDSKVPDYLCTEGTILNVRSDKHGLVAFLKGDSKENNGFDEVNLTIGKETYIADVNGNKSSFADIKVGSKVKAYYGPIATMSIPPMSPAKKVIVLEDTESDVIKLQENPSTGYAWSYSINDENIVKVLSDSYDELNTTEGIVGSSGIHTWNLKGLKEGKTLITFTLNRSWEQDNFIDKKEFIVKISKDLNVSISQKHEASEGIAYFAPKYEFVSIKNNKLTIEVKNQSDAVMDLNYSSGQEYNLKLYKNTKEVFNWESDKSFTDALRKETINQGDSKFYTVNLNNLPIDDSEYTFEFYSVAKELKKTPVLKLNVIKEAETVSINKKTYETQGNFMKYEDNYVHLLQDDIVSRYYAPGYNKNIKENSLIYISYTKEELNGRQENILKEIEEGICSEGTVTEVTKSKDGYLALLKYVNRYSNLENEVKLMINDTTIITDTDGNVLSPEEIKKSSEVKAFYSQMMTRSLPPMSNAYKIILKN